MRKIIVSAALLFAVLAAVLPGGEIDLSATMPANKKAESILGNVVTKVTDVVKSENANDTDGTIVRVKDGDTYVINLNGSETTVRLIGVDTPESVHSDPNRNTSWGKKISKWVKKTLKRGTKVALEYDEDPDDPYGRTLAYVYVDGKMFNKTLLKKGYAREVYYAPNGKYRKSFKKLEKWAKAHNKGFWKDGYSSAFPS